MNVIVKRVSSGAFVALLLVACGGSFGGMGEPGDALGNLACPELRGGAMNASFEADAKANATLRAFVTASGDLAALAEKAAEKVVTACTRMGHDLGLPAEALVARPGKSAATAACDPVSAKIDAILRAGGSASLKAQATPPKCEVSASAEAACQGQCRATVDPGYVKAHCQPGHLSGECAGTCSGRCSGTCEGTCEGECAGEGKAGGHAAVAAGHCAGQCKGTCKGACSAECTGSCSVDFKEPKCDVGMKAPSADARCEGSCKAHADLTAECTPARVEVRASVETGEMPKLLATLRDNLPALIEVEVAYGARIGGDVEALIASGSELPRAFGQLTAHASSCLAAAASACVHAQASLRVSVHVSASVSAKAGAHGT